MGVLVQILAGSLICGLCACMGILFAFPSSTLKLFESSNTTLHRPMTESELALFGSLSSVGGMVGTPMVGLLLDRIGRKNTGIIFSLVAVLGWAMIIACNRVEVLLTAVFIAGLSGAAFLVVPVYVSEICQESIRGAMTSGSMIGYAFGMMIQYLLGGALEYKANLYVSLSLNVAVTVALLFMRESPTHLLAKGREKEAIDAICFYRRIKPDSKEVLEEINVIRQSLNPELDDYTPEEEQLKPVPENTRQLGFWQFLKKSSSTRGAIYVTLITLTASIFQGLVVLQVYAEPLFEEALPNISSNFASILLAVVAVLTGLVAAYLTEMAGRRPLLIYSSIATGLSCLFLGLQLQLKWGPSWLVAVNIYFFTAMFSFGGGTVPYVLLAEVFLPQVKSIVTMLVVEWAWFCNYVILFIFNPLLRAIGLGPCFYIFSAVSIFTAIYSAIYLPETKGLTVYEIQSKFTKKRSRNDRGF